VPLLSTPWILCLDIPAADIAELKEMLETLGCYVRLVPGYAVREAVLLEEGIDLSDDRGPRGLPRAVIAGCPREASEDLLLLTQIQALCLEKTIPFIVWVDLLLPGARACVECLSPARFLQRKEGALEVLAVELAAVGITQ
jgi:hypothetical protein